MYFAFLLILVTRLSIENGKNVDIAEVHESVDQGRGETVLYLQRHPGSTTQHRRIACESP